MTILIFRVILMFFRGRGHLGQMLSLSYSYRGKNKKRGERGEGGGRGDIRKKREGGENRYREIVPQMPRCPRFLVRKEAI